MVKIIESRRDFGSMNSGTIRYSNLTDEDKEMLSRIHNIKIADLNDYDLAKDKGSIFRLHRKNLGQSMGFDGNRMFMADQVHKSGTFFEVTQDYVEANPNGWTDIPEDILIVTENTPGVVIGHPVADCPVVMMIDRRQGISAIGHCSAELIDRRLPTMIGEVLQSVYGSRADDVFTYVSACAGDGWVYDGFPKWAKDQQVWDRCIVYGDDGLFHIHLKPALLKQILSAGIQSDHVMFNMDDTILDPNYYSNSASSQMGGQQESKYGRHFAGMFFENADDHQIVVEKGKSR